MQSPRALGPIRALVVVAALTAVAFAPTTALAAPHIPLTDPLPPAPGGNVGEDASARCGADGLECLRFVEAELAGWEERFGCDHRAVFPTVYRLLTAETRMVIEDDPATFDDPAGLGFEALAFYELYEEMITAHLDGQPIPEAWQTAMDAANEGDWTAGHDMLLAINAHVQRDMPFAVARAGLRLPDGETSRKADHDRFNAVLTAAYPTIVQAVGERYDPIMFTVDGETPADNIAAQQLVSGWREGVWRNAERLVQTDGTALYDVTVRTIEDNAQGWASTIATGEIPGYRETRDEYCRAQLAAQAPSVPDATASPSPSPSPTSSSGTTATSGGTSTAAQTGMPATGGGHLTVALLLLAAGAWGRASSRTPRAAG